MTIPEEKRAGYISLKEASERFGYSQDYLGQLIRKGKLDGKLVYSHVAWVTTPEAIQDYIVSNKNKKSKKAQVGGDADFTETSNDTVAPVLSEQVGTTIGIEHDDVADAQLDFDAQSSRTATALILLFRVLIFAIVIIAIFVFYILTTAFGDEVKTGSRVAHASQAFSLSLHADHHE